MTRSRQTWAVVIGAMVCLALVFSSERLVRSSAMSAGLETAAGTLRRTVNALEGHLRRFETLPALLAGQTEVRAFLTAPTAPAQVAAMNGWLKDTNRVIEPSDLYLIGPDRTTLAASNHDREDSFIGQNFADRPHFTEAIAGRQGRFFALGTTSGVRGYDCASHVQDGLGQIVGLVALKIGGDDLEAS